MMALRSVVIVAFMSVHVLESVDSGHALSHQLQRTSLGRLEKRASQDIHQNEEKERRTINVREMRSRPAQEVLGDPIDDSQRVSALVMMAQQRIPQNLRIPDELHEIIHQYSDHHEIRTLFHTLNSPVDRVKVFGFQGYEAMHKRYRTKAWKVAYLSAWERECSFNSLGIFTKIQFDPHDVCIHTYSIWVYKNLAVPVNQNGFNWDAVAELTNLKELSLMKLDIAISMDDIQKVPGSLRELGIRKNIWTTISGDVDVGLLPRGLQRFNAICCRGMNGTLKLDAPDSNLRFLGFTGTDLRLQIESSSKLPPSLKAILEPQNTDVVSILLLREKEVSTLY